MLARSFGCTPLLGETASEEDDNLLLEASSGLSIDLVLARGIGEGRPLGEGIPLGDGGRPLGEGDGEAFPLAC